MDVRRELGLIRKHHRHHTRNFGESVVYFEYIPGTSPASAGSQFDDVYDEGILGGGGRIYAAGVVVPVVRAEETEDQRRAIPEGRQPVQTIQLTATIEDFRSAGIKDPFEYQRHLNDMFLYDGRYYGISNYRVRGRASDDVLILLSGFEIYVNQDMAFDPGPTAMSIQDLPWPSTLADL